MKPFRHQEWRPRTEEEAQAIKELKAKLLQQGVIKIVQDSKFVSKSRLEPKKDGGFRLIVDLRRVNKCLKTTSFKYEALCDLSSLASPGEHMVSFDLKSGYYHVGIHPAHQQFLCTLLDGELVAFQALPFGLSTAPLVFTKFMRPMVAELRKSGHRVLPYLDDFLLLSSSPAEAEEAKTRASSLLASLGLERNPDKGVWTPTQNLVHLGIQVNLGTGVFQVPTEKWATMKSTAVSLIKEAKAHCRWLSAKKLAKLLGLLASLKIAMPQVATFTRSLYEVLSTMTDWAADVKLTAQALKDLQHFATLSQAWNGLPIWSKEPTIKMATDASDYGWGAATPSNQARGFFSQEEVNLHITAKELLAVEKGVQQLLCSLDQTTVLLETDNLAVKACISKGSSKSPTLMPILRRIQEMCWAQKLRLVPVYVPSQENVEADRLSRIQSKSDWEVSDEFFEAVSQKWGPFQVDRFATAANTKTTTFNSWRPEPGSSGDAFQQHWGSAKSWVNPPFCLATQVVRKCLSDRADAVLLLPNWPSAPWTPLVENHASRVWQIPPSQVSEIVVRSNPAVPEPLRNPRWGMLLVQFQPVAKKARAQVRAAKIWMS